MLLSLHAPLAAEPYHWQHAVIKGGGFITGLYFHPTNARVLYMRTDMGGSYRLDPDSQRWIPMLDWVGTDDYMSLHGTSGIALDPTDDQKVYMLTGMYLANWGTNAAILKSSDRGVTWSRTNLPFKSDANSQGRWCADRLALDPNFPSTLFVGTPGGLVYRSADSANTWEQVGGFPRISGNNFGVVSVEFTGGKLGQATQTIYAGVNRNDAGATLFRSEDAGASWSEVQGRPDAAAAGYLNKVVKDRDGNLLLVYINSKDINMNDARPKQARLYRYDTSAKTWAVLHATSGYGIGAVAADPKDAKKLMLTSLAKWSGRIDLWRSEDAGATWTPIQTQRAGEPAYITDGWPAPHWMIDIDIAPDDSDHVLISGVAGIYRTTQGTAAAQTWTFFNEGMEQACVNDVVSPPTGTAQVYSGTYDLAGFKHDDLTVSPPDFAPEMDGSIDLDFAQLDPQKMVRSATGKPFGAYSTDAGVKWAAFVPPAGVTGGGKITISADGTAIIWAPTGTPKVFRSTDGGTKWAEVSGLSSGLTVAADRVNAKQIYAYSRTKAELYRSTDAGVSFTRIASNIPGGAHVVAHPTAQGDLWIGGDKGLLHSTDSGTTWNPLEGVTKVVSFGLGKSFADAGYPALFMVGTVGDAKGIFRSDDTGKTWTLISDPAHQFGRVHAITGDPRRAGRVYLGTNGRGLIYGDPNAAP